MDLDNIHPANKLLPGERLAAQALAKTYGYPEVPCDGPRYREMKLEGSTIRLKFHFANSGLTTRNQQPPDLFEIAGEDRKFVPAQAVIEGDSVVVSHSDLARPVA
ncbi:MAG: sialate O-acetylesterase, partial [bacterium]